MSNLADVLWLSKINLVKFKKRSDYAKLSQFKMKI